MSPYMENYNVTLFPYECFVSGSSHNRSHSLLLSWQLLQYRMTDAKHHLGKTSSDLG